MSTLYTIYTDSYQIPITAKEAAHIEEYGITGDEIFALYLGLDNSPRMLGQYESKEDAARALPSGSRYQADIEHGHGGGYLITGEVAYIEEAQWEQDDDGSWELVSGSSYDAPVLGGINPRA